MARSLPPWQTLLRTPFPCDHIIQLYTKDEALLETLAHFVGSGLEAGEAAVVIALPERIAALTTRLAATGFRLPNRLDEGAFIAIDAQSCLAKFMTNGRPDRTAFREVVGTILNGIKDAGYKNVRLFGEMVDLLWTQNAEATLQLEELWTELIADYGVCLLCAYRITPADTKVNPVLLHQITRIHTHSVSADDDYLEDDVDGSETTLRALPRRPDSTHLFGRRRIT